MVCGNHPYWIAEFHGEWCGVGVASGCGEWCGVGVVSGEWV